jgi:hypothetical protein
MEMKLKKCLALLLALTVVLTVGSVAAFAEDGGDDIQPYSVAISEKYNNLTKSGSTLTMGASTSGTSNTTKASVQIQLYRSTNGGSSFSLYKTYPLKSQSGTYAADSQSASGLPSGTYCLVTMHTCYYTGSDGLTHIESEFLDRRDSSTHWKTI